VIFPPNRLRVFVATRPVDFRKGHDGLAAVVRNELRKDPFTGTVFVFRAKRADRAKIVYCDRSGLVMIYKRLEEHRFACGKECWNPVQSAGKDQPVQDVGPCRMRTMGPPAYSTRPRCRFSSRAISRSSLRCPPL